MIIFNFTLAGEYESASSTIAVIRSAISKRLSYAKSVERPRTVRERLNLSMMMSVKMMM